jgi:hypothetical protein
MYCTNCGSAIPAEASFCGGCGSPVAARPAVPIAQSGFQHARQFGSVTVTGPQPNQAAAPPFPDGYAPPYPGQYGPTVRGRHSATPGGPAADFGPGTVTHWVLPVGRSWQSLVAGYLALLAIVVWPLGPFALGLGAWALVRSARENAHGTGRAVFAVIVGLLATFLSVAVLLPR